MSALNGQMISTAVYARRSYLTGFIVIWITQDNVDSDTNFTDSPRTYILFFTFLQ